MIANDSGVRQPCQLKRKRERYDPELILICVTVDLEMKEHSMMISSMGLQTLIE